MTILFRCRLSFFLLLSTCSAPVLCPAVYSGRCYSSRQDEEAVIRDAAEVLAVEALAAVSAAEDSAAEAAALGAEVPPARGNISITDYEFYKDIDIFIRFIYSLFIVRALSSAGTSVWFTPKMSAVRSRQRP